MAGQAVLVIEADRALQRKLVSDLNSEGFAAVGASDATEGIRILQRQAPALVLAGIHLPDIPGLDLLSAVRRTSQRIPVLFLATSDDAPDIAAVLEAGAAGIVPRSTADTAVLLHSVRSALLQSRLLDDNDQLRARLTAGEQSHTEYLKLQARLFQAEKATAIGRLASSIAHDLNNILTVMSGFAQCLKAAVSPDTIARDYADRIENAASRANDMSAQLAEFGRGKMSVHISTDLNRIVSDVARLLSRTIDNHITVHTAPGAGRPWVLADSTRLQLALLNLGASAGNAMPGGGDLTYETRNLHVDPASPTADTRGLPFGDYIEVAIRDTGGTMDEGAAHKAIDPLCGGKSPGYAAELGLSGVQNCVREHNGQLSFHSRPGEHRAIVLRLPVAAEQRSAEGATAVSEPPRASGRILLADDEDMIRTFVEQSLTGLGYEVTTRADGASAVEYYARHADSVDLVILDQNMPRLSGPNAFQKIKAINPAAKVVLCTGLDDTDAARQFTEAGGVGVLSKPFRLAELTKLVAQTIGGTKT